MAPRLRADWNEDDHPRDDDGQFAGGGGGDEPKSLELTPDSVKVIGEGIFRTKTEDGLVNVIADEDEDAFVDRVARPAFQDDWAQTKWGDRFKDADPSTEQALTDSIEEVAPERLKGTSVHDRWLRDREREDRVGWNDDDGPYPGYNSHDRSEVEAWEQYATDYASEQISPIASRIFDRSISKANRMLGAFDTYNVDEFTDLYGHRSGYKRVSIRGIPGFKDSESELEE